jgi:flagellar biosynthesis/type III secretory pathway chaperone
MADQVSDLLGVVREEITLYRDLVEHARQKTALLVKGSVEAILESNKVEDALCSKLRSLEMDRKRLCRQLAEAFRISREGFTLMKLAEKAEPSIAPEIRSQAGLFRNLVRQLRSITQRNRKLIEHSLHYSRELLAVFSNASGSYRPNGLFAEIPTVQPTFSQRA